MKGRENIRKAPSADLLVCFPPRAHLTLMPKPICSPSRAIEPSKRHRQHHHRLKKSTTRGGSSGGGAPSSPLLWAKNKQMNGGSEIAEPTSPKVTCAGQIKVRHKGAAACKSWQSVMEEIERIHNSRKNKKRPAAASWVDSIGFKKEVMQFLTCLRNIRFDFRCFGSIPQSEITSDDDEEEEEEEEEEEYQENKQGGGGADGDEASRTVFSKWFMVLQENDQNDVVGFSKEKEKEDIPSIPPANALLLMRCRSAPAKSWLEEKEEEEEKREEKKGGKNLKALMEEETRNSKKELESMVMMKYDTDFYKISSEIAKETWVNVGEGMKDPLSRSRSWKR